ncbi:hypothetical protein ACOMCU_01365 [Lysinibacillus sp. UGB7]|nr:hypothetical protein [Lysinibacillus sphaericus]
MSNNQDEIKNEEEIEIVEELDPYALDVIKRLYDGTIKDLVDR